jgi:exopolyphosphatase / guanosine-5'-triphosphate,3'-diphosphate pyrophosphatase
VTGNAGRWEWRTFGPGARVAETRWRDLAPVGTQESDEVYLLSGAGETVKVRAELMDIKQLLATDGFGLQQWTPVLKASFPIDRSNVERVFDALHVPVPELDQDAWTLDEFMRKLSGPSSGIRAVSVHKRRVRYAPNGCSAEITDVVADGRSAMTFAVEAEDAEAVAGVVRSLRLANYLNTAYPVGLARIVDGIPERYAVIDCGTNSIKFHLAERTPDGGWKMLVDRAELTRIGEGLTDGGPIGREPLERAVTAISGMVQEARAHDVIALAAVGTAALRMASNRDDVRAEVARRTGVDVEVIPGDEETRLAFLAVRAGLPIPSGTSAVLDTGGGSTQLTFGHDVTVDEQWSVNVGAVRYTEAFRLDDAVSPEVLGDALAAISRDLARLDGRPPVDALVGMGGAVTNLTAVSLGLATYDPDRVQAAVLERSEIDRQIELFRTTRTEDRRAIVGLQPKRAEVILAGACIVRTVMDKLGAESLVVSDRGLRHGVLEERFGAKNNSEARTAT